MGLIETLEHIRPAWLSKVSRRLARGAGVRESFQEQLQRFFDLMVQALETGDPAWLNSLLDEWVEARTQTELENQAHSLHPILEVILGQTYNAAHELLPPEDGLELIGALLPIYSHAFEYTSRKESDQYIANVSRDLDKARQTLERLDKSKSDFIAIAAHELKTPLTLIEGYASMLRDQLYHLEGETHNTVLLKGVDNGTRRLREIIDDMIDVSMIDNNMLSLNYQPVWLNRLFKVIQGEFDETLTERGQTLDVRPFPGSDLMTFGDGERLYQALRNVVSNAIKYTPDGGLIVVDGRILPGFVEITVQDTGIGIDAEDHSLIFEKFGRIGSVALHSSGKTKFKGGGPGLGLPIAKGIIEGHGGTIWVESDGYDETKCQGAIFHILLPLRKEPVDGKTAALFRPLIVQESGASTAAAEGTEMDV